MSSFEKYSNKIPEEIKDLVKGIDHELRYAIMMCLLTEGDQKYKQLQEKLGVDGKILRRHLGAMTGCALIESIGTVYFGKDGEGKDAVAFDQPEELTYGVTSLGGSFMKGLYNILEPSTRKEAREWELRDFKRLGINPKEIRIAKMKRTKELKRKAFEILKENPDIKPKELKEKLGADLRDFDRVTRVINYEWSFKDI